VGVVSPILFLYGIQLRAIPGQARTRPCCPVLACTHRVSPFHRILPLCISELTQHLVPSRHRPYSRWLGRIIANGRACRFCVRAVTLATRTCMRLRVRLVWGLSSAAFNATVSLPVSVCGTVPYNISLETLSRHLDSASFASP
jgi:hypothetical protein